MFETEIENLRQFTQDVQVHGAAACTFWRRITETGERVPMTDNSQLNFFDGNQYRRKATTRLVNGVEVEDDWFTGYPEKLEMVYFPTWGSLGASRFAFQPDNKLHLLVIDSGMGHKTRRGAYYDSKARGWLG